MFYEFYTNDICMILCDNRPATCWNAHTLRGIVHY